MLGAQSASTNLGPPGGPPWPNRPLRPPPGQSHASVTQTWKPIDDRLRQPKLEALGPSLHVPLTKRQLKHRQNRDSKLAKKFVSLDAEISNLKSQIEALKEKITKASKSTNAGLKRKKMRSIKREVNKINERLRESETAPELVEPRVPKDLISGAPLKLHPPNRSKCIETKIAELNKKIRRAKNRQIKECLITKREAL